MTKCSVCGYESEDKIKCPICGTDMVFVEEKGKKCQKK